jgi:triacylglycerol esterase/lipase EstA (alpha/beta hydrolase family)
MNAGMSRVLLDLRDASHTYTVRVARRQGALLGLVLTFACLVSVTGARAASGAYAPLDRPGPPLSVPLAKLKPALSCTSGVASAARNPILLVPGTDLDPGPNYSWNYERAFAALKWPYCTITLPDHATNDIQVAGEYLVYALRTVAAIAHRQVDILGYSQGGMVPRWALRFWPDTRPLVHTYVALDPSNHGTLDANATCQQQCSAADWQQAAASHFILALNSFAETFAGIDYTVIFSHTDEIVVPNTDASGSSSLHTGAGRIANIAVQQICPNDTSEHLAMGSYDPVGYALAVDAFSHESLADPSRIPATVCAEPFQPGVNPASFAGDYSGFLSAIGNGQNTAPQFPGEPAVKCYVFASCKLATVPTPTPTPAHKHQRHHKRHRRRHKHHRSRHKHRHLSAERLDERS